MSLNLDSATLFRLQRLSALEFGFFIQTIWESEPSDKHDANLWLEAAGAKPIRGLDSIHGPGQVWMLRTGELMFSNLEGSAVTRHPLAH